MKFSTETIFFIPKHQVPTGRKATYENAVCNYRPLKDDPTRVTYLSILVIPYPLMHTSLTPNSSLIAPFQPLVPDYFTRTSKTVI